MWRIGFLTIVFAGNTVIWGAPIGAQKGGDCPVLRTPDPDILEFQVNHGDPRNGYPSVGVAGGNLANYMIFSWGAPFIVCLSERLEAGHDTRFIFMRRFDPGGVPIPSDADGDNVLNDAPPTQWGFYWPSVAVQRGGQFCRIAWWNDFLTCIWSISDTLAFDFMADPPPLEIEPFEDGAWHSASYSDSRSLVAWVLGSEVRFRIGGALTSRLLHAEAPGAIVRGTCTAAADQTRFVVVWVTYQPEPFGWSYDIKAARIDGATPGAPIIVASGPVPFPNSVSPSPSVSCMDDGSFVVAWGVNVDGITQISMRRYDAAAPPGPIDLKPVPVDGACSADPATVTVATAGPSMVSSSKIAVVWQDDVQGFAVPVYRRIGGAGAFHDCVPSIIPTEEIQQDKYLGISGQHTAVLRPDGLLAVAWRSPLFDANIYCTVRRLFCRGDLDGDGTVDSGDLAILLGNWGSCEGCPADLNCDGEVDGADLAILLGNWGPCK